MTPFQPIRVYRAHFVVTCLAIAALALAACSGAATAAPTASPTAPPTAAPTATPTAPPTSTPTAAATAASMLPAAVRQPQTIHLILHATNDTVGSLTGCSGTKSCQGDFMVGYDPLYDAASGKKVGTFAYECFLVDTGSTLYHCPGVTITLTGRGQIVFTEVIQHEPGMPPAIAPITGGTDEFLGATGTVTAGVLANGGDFVITITR
jgi:hypothetical protein